VNGAESLVRTAVQAGVELCFANPGTTEMPLVAALDAVPGMRCVLGLFEGVCTGAADGYGRMAGKPALTLLHLGPGFANGIANLHNARRARSPVVNLVGDHATWHLPCDAPLTTDLESLARPVSSWLRRVGSAAELAPAGAQAIVAAATPPGAVATLIVPADCQWEEAAGPAPPRRPASAAAVPAPRVAEVAAALRGAGRAALLLGGPALCEPDLLRAGRIASATGARLLADTFVARCTRGAGRPRVERIPYFPDAARSFLRGLELLVRVGTREPVSFFGYRGEPSLLTAPGTRVVALAEPEEDVGRALDELVEALGAGAAPLRPEPAARPPRPTGRLAPDTLGAALAALQPEHAIVVDEAATSGLPWYLASAGAPPHEVLALTGGAIGQGLPCATGAALACPERRVIAFQADGSAAYTLQALWTQAREGLDVTTLLCANRSYRILQIELARAGVAEPGPAARSLTELTRPELDWCALARGLGVPGSRPASAEELSIELEKSFAEPGPRLIEVQI
jgi:acetolactate synthase-1/2/3 large subunit